MRLGGIESLMGSNQSIVFEGKMPRSQVMDSELVLRESEGSIRRALSKDLRHGSFERVFSILNHKSKILNVEGTVPNVFPAQRGRKTYFTVFNKA